MHGGGGEEGGGREQGDQSSPVTKTIVAVIDIASRDFYRSLVAISVLPPSDQYIYYKLFYPRLWPTFIVYIQASSANRNAVCRGAAI